MSVGYGTDISALPDLSFGMKTGGAVVAEALARRLTTPTGSLVYAVDYGWDVGELQLAKVSTQSLFQWKAAIEQECLRDERVSDVAVHLTFNSETGIMFVEVEATLFDGETIDFRLTVSASDVTLDLLDLG
jgi:hypothetical protein